MEHYLGVDKEEEITDDEICAVLAIEIVVLAGCPQPTRTGSTGTGYVAKWLFEYNPLFSTILRTFSINNLETQFVSV
jgi:hypothetical protein